MNISLRFPVLLAALLLATAWPAQAQRQSLADARGLRAGLLAWQEALKQRL